MSILLANAFLYGITFVVSFKKNGRHFSLYNFIFLVYFVVALLGCFIYGNGIYEKTYGGKNVDFLEIWPYLLCFVCVFLVANPLKKFSLDCLSLGPIKQGECVDKIVNLIIVVQIVNVALFLVSMRGMSVYDYAEIYEMEHAGESISTLSSPILKFVYGKAGLLSRILAPICHILCFYEMAQQSNGLKPFFKSLVFVSLACIPQILTGSRGGIFFLIADYSFFVILFWMLIGKRVRKMILCTALVGGAVLMTSVIAISNARFSATSDTSDEIFRYFGEPFPNLGFNIWNHDIRHPYGARYFPSLIRLESRNNYSKNQNDLMYFWGGYVGIPMINFKTLFGDLYIEFGVLGALLISSSIFLCMRKITFRKRMNILDLVYIFYCFHCCIYGLFGFSLKERFFMDLILVVIIVSVLKKTFLKNAILIRNS